MNPTLSDRLLGVDTGLLAFLLRLLALPFVLLNYALTTVRNALYDAGLLPTAHMDVPVVSVGNLTVGGTGKTPMVIALAQRAAARGLAVAVVARGYGAVADDEGRTDEVALIAARVPQARLVMSPDKLLGARAAAAGGADLILVDDGFQHRRLQRDFDLVMVDARAPFGNGMLLPGGGLREPASGLGRADAIVLTCGEALNAGERQTVVSTVRAFRFSTPIVWARHEPIGVRPVTGGELLPPATLAGQDVFLFCGIASPDGFRHTVESLGARVTGVMGFRDHHDFAASHLARVRAAARSSRLLCTEKDALKVARIPGSEDVWCLVIDLVLDGELPPIPGLDQPWTPRDAAAGEADAHH